MVRQALIPFALLSVVPIAFVLLFTLGIENPTPEKADAAQATASATES